jgi:hypothetical protein
MRIGVAFPHHVIGLNPSAIRYWAQTTEDAGYDDLAV